MAKGKAGWKHDADPSNEWWYQDGQRVGVTREENGKRWACALTDDGLPVPGGSYEWYFDLADALREAERLNATDVLALGSEGGR